ncbi:MAG TPA: Crp/Fnr family transcriptional regulator [Acidobacteriaceae bacterium]|nr:Crp/Fnr family transcriptional regulator [Acidobacteriaceae bacterium]
MSLSPAALCYPYFRAEHAAFHNLPPETLSDLDAISAPVEYRNGATLMRQGDPPRFVKILCDGHAKISTASQGGKSMLLNIVSTGAILGLGSAIRRMQYETTAEAYGPCVVNEIADRDFLDFLFRHRNANWQVMQMLAEENHDLLVNARRVALSGTVAGNVAKLLLDWGATIDESNGTKHFKMVLTHQEIAEMVGTTRETVTRALASFRQHGWIRIHGASVEILQQEKMKDIAI